MRTTKKILNSALIHVYPVNRVKCSSRDLYVTCDAWSQVATYAWSSVQSLNVLFPLVFYHHPSLIIIVIVSIVFIVIIITIVIVVVLPSPCTAFSQSFSVNSLGWRTRGERSGNAWTKTECACVCCFLKFKRLQDVVDDGFFKPSWIFAGSTFADRLWKSSECYS